MVAVRWVGCRPLTGKGYIMRALVKLLTKWTLFSPRLRLTDENAEVFRSTAAKLR